MMQGDNFRNSATRIRGSPGGRSSSSLAWKEGTTPRSAPNQRRVGNSCVDPSSLRGATFGRRPREGSNKSANGANQNCGNFLTDKPTARVHAPPGGRSSISLGGYVAESVCARSVARKPTRGDASCIDSSTLRNAEYGRRPREGSNKFANGANQKCGNFITDTPTTRVHAPPGGRSSISLRGDAPESVCDRKASRRPTREDARSVATPMRKRELGRCPREGSNRFANGANPNCGNFITDTPTTRVHAPPGGRSSIDLNRDEIDHSKQKCIKKKMSLKSESTCVDSETSRAQLFSMCSSVMDEVLWGKVEFEENDEDDLPLGAEWHTFYMSRMSRR